VSLAVVGPEAAALLGEIDDPAGNLVLRAASAFRRRFGGGPWALTLEKRLPVASGLGGGSADAAATLRLLCRIENIAPGKAALTDIAAGLGADVPVCLRARAALMGGTGERIAPADGLEGLGIVAVNPRVPLSTAAVFGDFGARPAPGEAPAPAATRMACADWLGRIAAARNDLEAPAMARVPVIAEARAELAAMPGCRLARMTGSGATVFGLFDDAAARDAAARRIGTARPGWWVRAGRLV